MRRLFLLLAILFTSAFAQPGPTRQFIIRIEPVRPDFAMQNITEAERPVVMQHAAYLKAMAEQGQLVIAGQALDPAGLWGITIINAADADAAAVILAADPLIKGKLFRGTVVPFRTMFAAKPAKAASPTSAQ